MLKRKVSSCPADDIGRLPKSREITAMKFRHILVALLAFGVLAWGIFAPTFRSVPSNSDEMACISNLECLRVLGMLYAHNEDGYFPHSPNGSIASLQQLVDAFPEDFRPERFICGRGQDTPAAVVDGRLTLTNESCSYGVVPWRLKDSERNAILSYDKRPHHRDGRLVVLTHGTILFMDEDTFQKRIEEERVRFSLGEKHTTEEKTGGSSENPRG